MLDLLHGVSTHPSRPHPIRLNREFRSDLMWWRAFVESWNGISFLSPPPRLRQLQMASDASGSWGCGAWHAHSWFQLQWDERSAPLPIMVKELLPIVLAVVVWGLRWGNHRVICPSSRGLPTLPHESGCSYYAYAAYPSIHRGQICILPHSAVH